MSKKADVLFIFSAIFLIGTLSWHVNANIEEDKQALLDFLHNIYHSHPINWTVDFPVCKNWTGVGCNKDQSRVISLRLPGLGFHGPIPSDTLSRLSALELLSLRSNSLSGPFPSDFSKLGNLSSLYLQFNKFSGPLPSDFSVWKKLNILNLSNNGFNGSIPSSISNLTHLTALNLANNSLSGNIPDLSIPSLEEIDLSNNFLTGSVPKSLNKFPSWSFSGNNFSSENALSPVSPVAPPNGQPKRKSRKLSEPAILGIAIGGCVLGFVAVALLMVFCRSNGGDESGFIVKPHKKESASKKGVSERQDKTNRLSFFEGSSFAFDLEDLLTASAEVLGKGTFGTAYKAALEDATTLVVKRLKEVTVGKREFEQQMEIVGGIKHENVAPLRAYYYSKDEKLIVYDFYDQGSISSMLHGM